MSIHRSLKINSALLRSRNVWTRIERMEALQNKGELKQGDSVFGLPKVRTGAKKKKK